jgi:hypothetical protein
MRQNGISPGPSCIMVVASSTKPNIMQWPVNVYENNENFSPDSSGNVPCERRTRLGRDA